MNLARRQLAPTKPSRDEEICRNPRLPLGVEGGYRAAGGFGISLGGAMDAVGALAVGVSQRCDGPPPNDALPEADTQSGATGRTVFHLAPRQRQTLCFLLRGRAEKEIARELGLSRNTVHHYVKSLYLLFSVGTRGELMAHFLAPIVDQIEAGYVARARPAGWQNSRAYRAERAHPGTVSPARPPDFTARQRKSSTGQPAEARRVHHVHISYR